MQVKTASIYSKRAVYCSLGNERCPFANDSFFWVTSVQRLDQTSWRTTESVHESVWMIRSVPCRTRRVVWSRGLMDRALDLKPKVTQGCGFESRQEVSTTEVRPLSKALNPRLLPGRRNVGCPLLHLDGLNAENTFHSSLYFVFVLYFCIVVKCKSGQVRSMDSAKYVTQHKRIYINIGKKLN